MVAVIDPRRGETVEHPFDVDTAVAQVADGSFSTVLTDRWDRIGGGPLGGYSLAVCLRALQHTLTFPDPIAVSAFFVRPAKHGDVEIRTEEVRTGRQVATGESCLIQGGREVVRVLATFTDLDAARGTTLMLNKAPSLPDPSICLDPLESMTMPSVTVAERVEYRFAEMPGWRTGQPSGRPAAECWIRFKEPRTPDLLSLPLLVDAAAPAVMEIGALGSSTLELTVHLRHRPAAGWLACRISTRHVINGFHEEDFELWDCEGRLVAQSRQLALLPKTR